MAIITIPKKITNGKELIIVPKKDWERLYKIAKRKIFQAELEKGLREALEEVKTGKIIGPFDTAEDLIKSLSRK
ncbi:MAG: hypothetical protein CO145_01530 [Candidatus Nealsonbacteria bacterium CG_4_9_14_3_um_filter_37_13]|uniref:Uncharacterized protein n=2 Tax=Candidatus Nealsoniibacteriota TaxID=1817911 RepID=A0A2H0TIX1_9BACT|nr:MAG: hypothetical protein COU43_02360 [Candidatus Nealsonbacteria bacterium CG10_big_fil_rev_8_21_14_0_10_37_25]PJA84248.1 MAG: hypothetical protein CO145_01530 [Candidatus Nealsonbacteria bacterium CG_4_9_14_3_um_filter_37_13]